MSTTQIARQFSRDLAVKTGAENYLVEPWDCSRGEPFTFLMTLTVKGEVIEGFLILGHDNNPPPLELAYERIMEQL